MTRIQTWAALVVLAVGSGCIPKIDISADGGTFVVGPEGGIFSRNGAVLEFPKGAVDQEQVITVEVIDQNVPEVPMRKRISFGYRFYPQSLSLKQPIKVILPWIADRVPQAVDPGTFDQRRQAGTMAYEALPGAKTLTEYSAVEARADKLGLFWLTSPAQANVARLELDPEELTMRVGDTQALSARVVDPTGTTLDAGVTFTVIPPRVASVAADGTVTAKDPGTARIVARSGSQEAEAKVFVVGSAVGPTAFVHENPYPTGNDLWGGIVLPLGAVFVGANGTVLGRDAAGTITRLFSSPGVVFKAVSGSLTNAVAVGSFGTNGVVAALQEGQTAPKVLTFTSVSPRAVWFDGTHGLAAGEGDDVVVYRNGTWVRDDSPTREIVMSIAGDGTGAFVVLGHLGSLYRYDPSTKAWNSLYRTTLQVLLTAGTLIGNVGAEAWAVGGNQLWHFQGSGWTPVAMPSTPYFDEATTVGVVDQRVVIGGRTGKRGYAYLYGSGTYDGGVMELDAGAPGDAGTDGGTDGGFDAGQPLPAGWSLLTLRSPQIPRGFVPGGQTAWLLGDLGALYEYSQGAFRERSRGFYGNVVDVAAVDGGAYAAVNECVNETCTQKSGAVYSRSATGVWELLGPPQPFIGEVYSVGARGTDVTVSLFNAVYRYDGTSWQAIQVQGGLLAPLRDLKWCGGSLYGVGGGGIVYKGSSTLLAYQGTVGGRELRSIFCHGDNQIWVAGDQALFSKTGGATWASRTTPGVNHASYHAVWSPGIDEAFAFGDARYGVYWDTTQLNVIDGPGGLAVDVATGMWGSSIDNLYMVGKVNVPTVFGFALRHDGIQWRLVDSGSSRPVSCIDGSDATTIYLGTEGGGLLRSVPPPK